jgi:hypothetical protein
MLAKPSSRLPIVGTAKGGQLTPATQPAQQLHQLENGTTTEAALAFFDSLAPVETPTLIGSWRGRGVETGHPIDGLLELFGWHGKRFSGPGGCLSIGFPTHERWRIQRTSRIPVGCVVRHPNLFRHSLAGRLFRAFSMLLQTEQPKARLRMTEYRGVVSATMIYDSLPINDVFRKVDEDCVLGAMDMRFTPQPFFFVLRREGRPDFAREHIATE